MNLGFGKNYVVNLKRHTNRLESTLKILGSDNTNVIEAIDGRDYFNDSTWIKENLSPIVIDPNGWWTVGIICCALSHRKAWKTFLESEDETGCFFEDDIVMNDRFNFETIEEIRDGLESKPNWGCVFLGKYKETIKLVNDQYNQLNGHNVWGGYRRFHPSQWAAHAYILNRKSAQWLVDHQLPVNKALDVYLEFMPFDIYAPRLSQFNQLKVKHQMKNGGNINFKDINLEEFELVTSETMYDGRITNKEFLVGKGLPEYTMERKVFSLKKFKSSFNGVKFNFKL